MSLLDEVVELGESRRRVMCTVAIIRDGLDDATRAELDTLLTTVVDGRFVHAGMHIAKALTKRGLTVNGHTVQRHRNGDCSCTS